MASRTVAEDLTEPPGLRHYRFARVRWCQCIDFLAWEARAAAAVACCWQSFASIVLVRAWLEMLADDDSCVVLGLMQSPVLLGGPVYHGAETSSAQFVRRCVEDGGQELSKGLCQSAETTMKTMSHGDTRCLSEVLRGQCWSVKDGSRGYA